MGANLHFRSQQRANSPAVTRFTIGVTVRAEGVAYTREALTVALATHGVTTKLGQRVNY